MKRNYFMALHQMFVKRLMHKDLTEPLLEKMVSLLFQCFIVTRYLYTATVYGKGVYFARDAFYSAQDKYSPPDANGLKHMYHVRVLTGEYTLGTADTIVPPPKDPQKDRNVLFDSTVENVQDPTIFVTYNDAQAYPEYLITFTTR